MGLRVLVVIAVAGLSACASDNCPDGTEMGIGDCKVPLRDSGAEEQAGPMPVGTYPHPIGTTVGGSGGVGGRESVGTAGAGGSVSKPSKPSEAGHGVEDSGAAHEPERGGAGGATIEPDAGTRDAGGDQGPTAGTSAPPVDAGMEPSSPPPAAGMTAPPPPPAPRCGDGTVDQGETCDGNCETSCDDGDPCTADVLAGDSAHCNVACKHTAIVSAKGGDGCCPSSANANTDSDCSASCGNHVGESGETCDGDCPTSCDDGNPCTTDTLVGSAAQCTAKCTFKVVTAAKSGDGCCPSGANASNDGDCAPVCGNGVKESGEVCDGACPTSCPASSGCTKYALTGSASACNSTCSTSKITDRVNGDGCCPSGADFNSDNDCAAPAGCKLQSAGNLLKNAGFASNLDGWKVEGGSGSIAWSSGDVDSCSASGSAQLTADHAIGQYVSQCVPISGGTYRFAAKIKGGGDGGETTCAVVMYQLSGCSGSGKEGPIVSWLNVDWGPTGSTSFDVDASLTSAWVGCFLDAHNVTAASEVDELYLGRTDAAF